MGVRFVVARERTGSIIHSVVVRCTFDTAIMVVDVCVDDRCTNAARKRRRLQVKRATSAKKNRLNK